MIQASGLSKAYGTQVIFDNVGFSVHEGERIGLVGRNGHGKTTLLKIIAGDITPDTGTVSIPNNYRIGYLSQHLLFTQDSVLNEACLGLKPDDQGKDETYMAEKVLMGIGFMTDDFLLHPHELSGGFQVRLNLAKLLVSAPDLLLLDEPTNYLDIVSIRWLTGFLKAWKRELILITHDREFMDGVTTHTMGIHRKNVRKITGPTTALYQQIVKEEEIYEKTRVNQERQRSEVENFIRRFRAQATRARAVQSKIKALRKKGSLEKISAIKNLEFEFKPARFTGKSLIEAKDLSFSFTEETPLLQLFNLTVRKKDRIGVIGKNGRGKTTLLNLLAGELAPLSGKVVHHPHLKTAFFAQTNIQRLDPHKTVEEEILDSLPEYERNTARNICGTMMFEGDRALKKVRVLSGGEKSRVLLGKLLISPANLLLLDEPTNHLDMESVDSLLEAIDAFEGAVIIVTHSEMILDAVATRLVVFDQGRVHVFEGTYRDFLERSGWHDETPEPAGRQASEKKGIGRSRRDLKRIRAELINDRSRTLGPLQSEIDRVETVITELEQQVDQETEALVAASVKGDGKSIRHLSMSIHNTKGKIDDLFTRLEKLTEMLDTKTNEFENKFKQLKQAGRF